MSDIYMGETDQQADGTHYMSKIFEERVIMLTGETGEHVLGPWFMALLDFYIATSI